MTADTHPQVDALMPLAIAATERVRRAVDWCEQAWADEHAADAADRAKLDAAFGPASAALPPPERIEIGADGCGCPLTAVVRANGGEIEGTERTEHRAGCWNTAPRFLIWSNQKQAWWCAAKRGYTPYIELAGRYSQDEAAAIVDDATLGGRLVVDRVDLRTGDIFKSVDEVMLLAPESSRDGVR